MATILKITEDDYESAVDVAHAMLHAGGLVVYPTDTVYGIGADATSAEAVEKIHKVKGISDKRPMSVLVSDFGMIDYYCETGIWEDMILRKYLPGPYTFILRRARPIAASDTEKLGVRLPDSDFCRAMCKEFGRPIITTSANLTGQRPPTNFAEVDKRIIDAADLAIDGGPTRQKSPSVVIDLVDRKVIREGGMERTFISLPEA